MYAELTMDQVSEMFAITKFNITLEKQKSFVAALSSSGEGTTIKVNDFIKIAEDDLDSKKASSKVAKKEVKTFKNIRRF